YGCCCMEAWRTGPPCKLLSNYSNNVSAVLPTVSSCLSYYADRETWAALILLMGLSKAIINWGILAFYLDPANVPAAGNNLFVAARRIPFVAAVTEGVLAVLPYFPADEGLQQHAAIVTIAGVSAFVGSAINFKLMDLIFGEETPGYWQTLRTHARRLPWLAAAIVVLAGLKHVVGHSDGQWFGYRVVIWLCK
ncbi:hypothetical protein MTO96_044809, partial [Rhipicephalus appendiculatus]